METPNVTPEPINTPPVTPEVKTVVAPPSPPKSNLVPLLLVLGLVVAIAIPITLYFTSTKNEPIAQVPEAQVPVVVSPTVIPFFLTLTNPTENTSAIDGEIIVSGKTLANITVAIVSDNDEVLIESDSNGNFESTVIVGPGGGLLQVTAYGPDGEEKTQTITFSATPTVTGLIDLSSLRVFAVALAKNDNNNGKAIAATKVTAAPKKDPKVNAFLQNQAITNKTQKLGVKALKELLSATSTPSATATISGRLKQEKWQVKQATSGATLKRRAIAGVITDLAEGTITVRHQVQTDRTYTVYYNLSTVISTKESKTASSSALMIGSRITAVGEISGDGILAKRIHVIPGKATGVLTKNPVSTQSADTKITPPATSSATPTLTSTPKPTATPTAIASPSATPAP